MNAASRILRPRPKPDLRHGVVWNMQGLLQGGDCLSDFEQWGVGCQNTSPFVAMKLVDPNGGTNSEQNNSLSQLGVTWGDNAGRCGAHHHQVDRQLQQLSNRHWGVRAGLPCQRAAAGKSSVVPDSKLGMPPCTYHGGGTSNLRGKTTHQGRAETQHWAAACCVTLHQVGLPARRQITTHAVLNFYKIRNWCGFSFLIRLLPLADPSGLLQWSG